LAPFNLANFLTPRGFTGHEHLDNVGLIHMNGRVYDQEIARFVSTDPLIPSSKKPIFEVEL
jgi:RHS repeat-associated protein